MLSWLFKRLLWSHRKMDANTESKQTYYLLHISYTNSEISIDLPNICAPLVRWLLLHDFFTLPFWSVSWQVCWHSHIISFADWHHLSLEFPLVLNGTDSRGPFYSLSISTLSCWLVFHGRSCPVTSNIPAAVLKKDICKYLELH